MSWHKTVWFVDGEFITTCCAVPIGDDDPKCPKCGTKIIPVGRANRVDSVQFINPEYVR